MKADRGEVLRYLGYKNQAISDDLNALIDACVLECENAARPAGVHRVFAFEQTGGGIRLAGANVTFAGGDIRRHIRRASLCAVMAVTLGAGVDALIRGAQAAELTRAVILDACASALVETACDEACRRIAAQAEGYALTARYSPGYGDFPLEAQPEILRLLNAQKAAGLTCTQDMILIPRKSVTAVIGLIPGGDAQAAPPDGCGPCRLSETCAFRRGGADCAKPEERGAADR